MREVVGMYVGGDPEALAHITVHYGERPASDFLLLQEIQQSEAGTLGRKEIQDLTSTGPMIPVTPARYREPTRDPEGLDEELDSELPRKCVQLV